MTRLHMIGRRKSVRSPVRVFPSASQLANSFDVSKPLRHFRYMGKINENANIPDTRGEKVETTGIPWTSAIRTRVDLAAPWATSGCEEETRQS